MPIALTFSTPRRVANVLILYCLSPLTSGKSLVMAITVAKMVENTVMKIIAGLHLKRITETIVGKQNEIHL